MLLRLNSNERVEVLAYTIRSITLEILSKRSLKVILRFNVSSCYRIEAF